MLDLYITMYAQVIRLQIKFVINVLRSICLICINSLFIFKLMILNSSSPCKKKHSTDWVE